MTFDASQHYNNGRMTPEDKDRLGNALIGMGYRPHLYARTRENYLNIMFGIIVGSYGCLLVPGPNFQEFETEPDEAPTQEWAKPVTAYVLNFLKIDAQPSELRQI